MKRTFEEIEAACQRSLDTMGEQLGKGATVILQPFNASLKPCSAATEIEDMEFAITDAPLMPLPDCVAPSHCVCVYSIRKMGN